MKELLFLLLIFLGPSIFRWLMRQSQTRSPGSAAPPRRPRPEAAARPDDAETPPEDAAEPGPGELPDWLRELLGQREAPAQEPAPAAPRLGEGREISPLESEEEARIWPSSVPAAEIAGDETQQAEAVARAYLATATPAMELPPEIAAPPRARRMRRHAPWLGRRGGPAHWRRAVILAEIIGPPRALRPWRSLADEEL